MEDSKDPVAARAYELWEKAGRPDGGADDFWYRAERECKPGMTSALTSPTKPSGRKPALKKTSRPAKAS